MLNAFGTGSNKEAWDRKHQEIQKIVAVKGKARYAGFDEAMTKITLSLSCEDTKPFSKTSKR